MLFLLKPVHGVIIHGNYEQFELSCEDDGDGYDEIHCLLPVKLAIVEADSLSDPNLIAFASDCYRKYLERNSLYEIYEGMEKHLDPDIEYDYQFPPPNDISQIRFNAVSIPDTWAPTVILHHPHVNSNMVLFIEQLCDMSEVGKVPKV